MTTLVQPADLAGGRTEPDTGRPMLEVTVPVYNEEADLASCVRRLHAHLTAHFPYPFLITIADNASTDRTPQVAAELSRELDRLNYVRLEQKGRGRALSTVWGHRRPRWWPTSTWTCPPT